MTSPIHEALVQLFRIRPALAAELLRDALNVRLPRYTDVRIDSAEFTEIQPAIPEITDEAAARADPELAVLSAVAHGHHADSRKAARIAAAAHGASDALDEDRAQLYVDLVLAALSAAARRELRAMDPAKYEYQSAFAKRCVAKGRAEGKAEGKTEGRAALLTRQLTLRFGALPPQTHALLGTASVEELDAIGERLLVAKTLDEALRST